MIGYTNDNLKDELARKNVVNQESNDQIRENTRRLMLQN